MKKIILKYSLSLFFVAFYLLSNAQLDTIENKAAIKVMARPLPDRIVLRWAPSTPLSWQLANQYGYTIERICMTRKNKLVKKRTVEIITANPILLLPEERWESVVIDENGNVDRNAAIAAQALFGESFNLTESFSNNIAKVIEKAQNNQKRFTFALFSADQSLKVAQAMGLAFVDSLTKKEEKYLYRIYANVPKEKLAIDTGFVFVGTDDYEMLPKPSEFNGKFEKDYVTLSWNREQYESVYCNYIIERSENGKDFYPLEEIPFINTSPVDRPDPQFMYRVDSLPEKKQNYYYRVKGRTPFDEFGPWSDTVSGQSVSSFDVYPEIKKTKVVDNKEVHVFWEFPSEKNVEIEYINLLRAKKAKGPFHPIAENLNPDQRSYLDKVPMAVNYYQVKVYSGNGQSCSSFPTMVQLVDSLPPEEPQKPLAQIDSVGNVTINWEKGKEEDILGYRVFRSNFLTSEFGQVTKGTVQDTVYNEKISIDNLNKKIYYKIAAIDRNFNQSELSEAILVIKPDIIPPVAPLFTSPHSTKEGAKLFWINSSSEDVVKYVLYRRLPIKSTWQTLVVFQATDSINEYLDTELITKQLYEYTMIAVDSSGNESLPCNSVFARRLETGIRPRVENLQATADFGDKCIQLTWENLYSDVVNFLVYRKVKNNPITFYKVIDGKHEKYSDKKIKLNTNYSYRIKAVFTDGSESAFSEEVSVRF